LSRPLALFAGIWKRWRSVRKVKEGATTNDLFALLTTEPNAIVAPIHAKAMPVILTSPAEVDRRLEAKTADTLALSGHCLTARCALSRRARRRTAASPDLATAQR
jgi:putative SOS response-associated peptidase YedK